MKVLDVLNNFYGKTGVQALGWRLSGVMPGCTRRGFPEDQRGVEDDEYGLREIGCGVGDRDFGWRVEDVV